MYKIDLHTHSIASPDGGIDAGTYKHVLESGQLDMVAITDHDTIEFALQLHGQLGDKIIVGEEIMTTGGEIVGLYLTRAVQPGLSPEETCKQIKDQGGLVYIPHPFETIRHGLQPAMLDSLADHIDIIEVINGRAFLQNRSEKVVVWAKLNQIAGAASSDAHGRRGLGRTYTMVKNLPARDTLVDECRMSTPQLQRPSLRSLLYPKYHKLRKKIKR